MEYYINEEVVTLNLNSTDSTLISGILNFNIDFEFLLRPFIEKYNFCNIELVSAAQGNFGGFSNINFFVGGLPWLNETNINTNSRVLGGYNRLINVLPSLPDRSLYRIEFVGQIETFSLRNLKRNILTIELRRIDNNEIVTNIFGFFFNI